MTAAVNRQMKQLLRDLFLRLEPCTEKTVAAEAVQYPPQPEPGVYPPLSANMPLPTQRVLISYAEYQRLLNVEKRCQLTQKSSSKSEASGLVGSGGDDGGGLEASVGTTGVMPVIPLPGMRGDIPNNFPTEINTNVLPPRPNPIVYTSEFEDRTDRIRAEARRDDSLPPALPLNDAFGVPDPHLDEGRAPTRQFVATPSQRAADESTSSGQPPSKRQAKWYLIGEADSSSDEDDLGELI